MEWLDDSDKALDSEAEIANEPDKIKMQLAQHKVTVHLLIVPLRKKCKSRLQLHFLDRTAVKHTVFNV